MISRLSTAEMKAKLSEADIAFGQINSVSDLTKHPALSTHPVYNSSGKMLELPAPAALWHAKEQQTNTTIPKTGEQTEKIREEFSQS